MNAGPVSTVRPAKAIAGIDDHLDLTSMPAEPDSIVAARTALRIGDVRARIQERLQAALPPLAEWIAQLPPRVFGVESGFFHMPVAQALLWELPADGWLERLGMATALGSVHYAAQDLAIDAGQASAQVILLSEAAQTLYLRELAQLWPDGQCAEHHDRLFARYSAAVMADQQHMGTVVDYTAADVLRLADKAAPLFMAFPLLTARTGGDFTRLPGVERALRDLCIGLQLCDDIADIAEDLACGYVSLPATMTLTRCLDVSRGPLSSGLDHAEVETRMYVDGVATALYQLAIERFRSSAAHAENADAIAVADLADYWATRATIRLGRIEQTLESQGRRS